MVINVYPSQDNPTTQTLWIFSGSSTTRGGSVIRTSTSSDSNNADGTEFNEDFYDANKPDDQLFQLSPLFSSANTDDIVSVSNRTAGVWGAGSPFANSATNTPTITIGGANRTRTISHLFMDDDNGDDDLGIRVSGSALSYGKSQSIVWVGAGLINKPIGDFFTGTFNHTGISFFAAQGSGSIRVIVNSQVIPEPEEYALVFGLFALGFVIFRRHWQRKQTTAHAGAN